MALIKVPKTPKKAFDTDRRPSALLLGQIAHLEWAALPASQRKPHQLPTHTVHSEGQVAERVAQLTRMILEAKRSPAADGAADAFVKLPPLPVVKMRPRSAKQATRGRRRQSGFAKTR